MGRGRAFLPPRRPIRTSVSVRVESSLRPTTCVSTCAPPPLPSTPGEGGHLWSSNIHAHLFSSAGFHGNSWPNHCFLLSLPKLPVSGMKRRRLQKFSSSKPSRRGREDEDVDVDEDVDMDDGAEPPGARLRFPESGYLFLNSRFGCGSVKLT